MNTTLKPNVSLESLVRLSFQGGGAFDHIIFTYQNIHKALEELNEANRLWSVVIELNQVYMWVLFAVGLPVNILSMITVLTMHAVTPAAMLLATLAGFDGVALIGKLIGMQILRSRIQIGSVGCKMEFLILFMSTMCNWILAYICVERYITLLHPTKRAILLSRKVVCVALLATVAVLLTIFAGVSITMRDATSSGYQCGVYADYVWFYKNIWFWINACMFLFIPCSIILPCIVLSVVQIVRMQKREAANEERDEAKKENNQLSQSEKQYHINLTAMVVIAAVFLIILCLPACIYYLTYEENDDLLVEAWWAVFEQIQFLLVDSSHAIKFFIYLMTSKIFRHQLIYLLSCKKYKGKMDIEGQGDSKDELKLQEKN